MWHIAQVFLWSITPNETSRKYLGASWVWPMFGGEDRLLAVSVAVRGLLLVAHGHTGEFAVLYTLEAKHAVGHICHHAPLSAHGHEL